MSRESDAGWRGGYPPSCPPPFTPQVHPAFMKAQEHCHDGRRSKADAAADRPSSRHERNVRGPAGRMGVGRRRVWRARRRRVPSDPRS
eukprot:6622396-Prymnesium_polylepis.1